MSDKLKVIELFAGLGTVAQALKELNIDHEVVAISEVDKFAVQSYEAIHGKANNLGDITKIKELPEADLWFYGFCCQDISVAGKLAGIKEGTRSGLLLEVERLLEVASDNGSLPKCLILENVKNLVGQRFKADFDRWLAFLESLGYKNYWKVLNTRDYAIPQNRERVFCVSIRSEHKPYKFPEKRELRLRLKDMLDAEVDEKFYLTERALKSLGHSSYNQERTRLQDLDGVHRTCCSRDFKSPTCVVAGELASEKYQRMHEQARRVYSAEGLSPTVVTGAGGGHLAKIVDDAYKGREPREYTDTAPTLRSGKCYDLKVVSGQIQPVNRDYKEDGEARQEHFECRKDDVSNAVLTGDRKNMVQIAAMRGRPNEHGEYTQRLEPSDEDVSHTLTNVTKDNLVIEPQVLTQRRTEYGKAVRKEYEAGGIAESRHNMTELVPRTDGVVNCLSTVTKDNLLAEAPYITDTDADASKCVRAGGHGLHYGHTWDVIADSTRIRKPTPTECLRLQGWRDRDINKIKAAGISNAQQYKIAGNGITTTVLIAIFGELFGVPYSHILDDWSWREDAPCGS